MELSVTMNSEIMSYNGFTYPTYGFYTIYSKKDCNYCTKVKKLLEKERIVVVECDSYLDENRDCFLEKMDIIAGRKHRTFPFVFKDENFLGGYDDTVLYLKLLKLELDKFISFTDEF